jgi:hypothetical protein
MQAGTRIHRKIQRKMGSDYHAEVPLSTSVDMGDYDIVIEGRADGVFYRTIPVEQGLGSNLTLSDEMNVDDFEIPYGIDEIKGVYLEPFHKVLKCRNHIIHFTCPYVLVVLPC